MATPDDEAWNQFLMEADVAVQQALEDARNVGFFDAVIIDGSARRAANRVQAAKARYEERATCYAAWFQAHHA